MINEHLFKNPNLIQYVAKMCISISICTMLYFPFPFYFLFNIYRELQSSSSSRGSYLLSDLLLHFDRGPQFCYLFNSFAGIATVFPQHIVLRVGGTNDG